MSKIDKASGLPELPEGQIWSVEEVRDSYGYYTHFEVQIVELGMKTKGFFRKPVETRTILASKALWNKDRQTYLREISSEAILAAAEYLIRKQKTDAEAKATKLRLLGDYPPNTLVDDKKAITGMEESS